MALPVLKRKVIVIIIIKNKPQDFQKKKLGNFLASLCWSVYMDNLWMQCFLLVNIIIIHASVFLPAKKVVLSFMVL